MSNIKSLVQNVLESTLNEYRTKGATGLKNMSPEELAAHQAKRDEIYQSKLTGGRVGRPTNSDLDKSNEEAWEVDNLSQSMSNRNNELEDMLNGVLLGYKKLLNLVTDLSKSVSPDKISQTQQYRSTIEDIKKRSNLILEYPRYPYIGILNKVIELNDRGMKCKYKPNEKFLADTLNKGDYLSTVKTRIRSLWEKFKNNELSYNDIKDVHEVEQYVDDDYSLEGLIANE